MRVVLALLTFGCAAKNVAEPVGNRAAPPPLPACTERLTKGIAKALKKVWNSDTRPDVRCTPGRFPTPGFFIQVDDENSGHYAGVLAPDGTTELVHFVHDPTSTPMSSIVACETVDLDGDGVDEIVETHKRDTGRSGWMNWLEVRRIGGRGFSTTRGPYTNIYHPDLGGCSAEVSLAGRTIVVTIENIPGIPPSDCLAAGIHTFALENGEVVEFDRLSRR